MTPEQRVAKLMQEWDTLEELEQLIVDAIKAAVRTERMAHSATSSRALATVAAQIPAGATTDYAIKTPPSPSREGWIFSKTSGLWHKVGASRMPRCATSAPGTEVLCGWKVQDDPVSAVAGHSVRYAERQGSDCTTCAREERRAGAA